jgi:N-acetylneuraminate synthase/N,N'-diacetyllegionaminate synthase
MKSNIKIIAEAGVNHNGDIELAKELIDAAAEAGVDVVKFQTFRAESLVNRTAGMAAYQKSNTKSNRSQFELLKNLELSTADHELLVDYSRRRELEFFSTAFDIDGLDYLNSLGFRYFKSPSGEITNYPYLRKLSQLGKPVILSTGMANLREIEEALHVLTTESLSIDDITILHCNTQYPTPMEDVNLTAMITIGNYFNTKFGYSDHTLGIEVPIAAVALGASVIEKHFTLDRGMDGPDHKASLQPEELKSMVEGIRNVEKAIGGNGRKEPSASERENLPVARKSIHTSVAVKRGEIIRDEMLIALRPGDGISPMNWTDIIGKAASRDLEAYEKLSFSDII